MAVLNVCLLEPSFSLQAKEKPQTERTVEIRVMLDDGCKVDDMESLADLVNSSQDFALSIFINTFNKAGNNIHVFFNFFILFFSLSEKKHQ